MCVFCPLHLALIHRHLITSMLDYKKINIVLIQQCILHIFIFIFNWEWRFGAKLCIHRIT